MNEDFEQHDDAGSDTALISLVGSAFDEGRRGRDTQDDLARGRALRRRKRAVPALAALGVVAASASLAVALTGPSGAANTTNADPGHSLTANGTAVNVDNAAFSVHTDTKTGKVMSRSSSSSTSPNSSRSWPRPASAATSTPGPSPSTPTRLFRSCRARRSAPPS